MQTIFKQISITYFFNHSKMGFSNSVTVNAISIEDARSKYGLYTVKQWEELLKLGWNKN